MKNAARPVYLQRFGNRLGVEPAAGVTLNTNSCKPGPAQGFFLDRTGFFFFFLRLKKKKYHIRYTTEIITKLHLNCPNNPWVKEPSGCLAF